jgi:hypothetical protein
MKIFGQHARAPFDRRNPLGTDRLDGEQQPERILRRQYFKKCLRHLEAIIGRTGYGIKSKISAPA